MSLSICIPTRNRYPFLKWTLDRLQQDFPAAEIIVSDNDSTDDTRSLKRRARYLYQDKDVGAFANMRIALQASEGDFAVYCADDDYLLPVEIARGIEYLELHPQVSCYCAPCEIYDEVADKTYWNAFKVPSPVTFAYGDGIELFNFLIENHVWPEHYIYRVPVPLPPRNHAYWAFADIPHLLEAGAIHFAQAPFYRNVLVHPVGLRIQLGNQQCLTHFDQYRAGLEVLAFKLFGKQPYKARHHIQEMIQSFICTRLDRAMRIHLQCGQEDEADLCAMRIAIGDPRRDIQLGEVA